MFLNAFELPQTHNGIVHFPGSPRQYRADCKAGVFKIGEEVVSNSPDSLDMEILAYRSFNSELFGYPYQQWLEVFFVDRYNTVSHILFKTESISNFVELIRKLIPQQKAVGTQIVTAKTSKRSSDNGTYYVVNFEAKDNEVDRVDQLCSFANANINELYAGRLAQTFEQPAKNPELPASTTNSDKLDVPSNF